MTLLLKFNLIDTLLKGGKLQYVIIMVILTLFVFPVCFYEPSSLVCFPVSGVESLRDRYNICLFVNIVEKNTSSVFCFIGEL